MEQTLQIYIDKLLKSEEYLEYVAQRERIMAVPGLKDQVDAFRTRNYQMQTSRDLVFERIEAFEREYADFLENPLVIDFLDAELAFCRILQRHYGMIMEAIDFN